MSDDTLGQLRDKIAELLNERSTHQAKLDEVLAGAEERGDGNFTDEEQTAFAEHRDKIKELDEQRTAVEARVADIESALEARKAAEESAKRFGGTSPVSIRGGAEEQVYRPDDRSTSFFRDIYLNAVGNPAASERLARHMAMNPAPDRETRDVSTSDLGEPGGLVIPSFLTERFAPVARARRPFADFIGSTDLPAEGLTVNVPQGNTGTLVLSQTSQNSAVAERDYTVEDIVVPVVTIAGQNNLSRQSVIRGRNADDIVMRDLARAYSAELDRQVINGSGSSTQHFGVMTTTGIGTVTVTSTTASTQLRQIADAVQQVHTNRFEPVTVIAVHPRRWAYWTQAVDGNGRPLLTPEANGPQNAFGLGDLTRADGIVGSIQGIPVLQDPNIPTTLSYDVTQSSTTDPIIVANAMDYELMEDTSDGPTYLEAFPETLAGQLTVKLVAFGFSAFTAARYQATGTITLTGSGLTTPVFAS